MPDLESAVQVIAQRFARELVRRMRRLSLDDVLDSTRVVRAALVDAGPIAAVGTPRGAKNGRGKSVASARIDVAVAEAASAHGLNEREELLLRLAVKGTSRRAIMAALGVPANTYKVRVRTLLKKLAAENLAEAAMVVLHRAVALP